MIDIQNINGYGIEDPGFALLREVAQKYCPEELQAERKEVIPDEALDLSSLAGLLQTFVGADYNSTLTGGSLSTPLPQQGGDGGGSGWSLFVPPLSQDYSPAPSSRRKDDSSSRTA